LPRRHARPDASGPDRRARGAEDVYDLPQTTFGAEFLGTATRIPGVVVRADGDDSLDVETSIGTLRCRSRDQLAAGAGVLVYIRPESVQPAVSDSAPGALVCEATVLKASFMGDTLDWLVDVRGTSLKARTLANTETGRRIKASVGKPLRVQVPTAACVPAPGSEVSPTRSAGPTTPANPSTAFEPSTSRTAASINRATHSSS